MTRTTSGIKNIKARPQVLVVLALRFISIRQHQMFLSTVSHFENVTTYRFAIAYMHGNN
jgi:hypothetical protein